MSKLRDYILEHDEINKSKLCLKANISRPTLDNILSDNPRYTPSFRTVRRICKVLGLDWAKYL